jgi:hypothetical protein
VALWRLLVAAVAVTVTILASLGPIVAFFSVSTTSYSFMVVLNVLLLAVAGLVGLGFLLRVLKRLAIWQAFANQIAEVDALRESPARPDAASPTSATPAGSAQAAGAAAKTRMTIDRPPSDQADLLGPANAIFRIWVVIFGLVGAQMGWLLRPFIGSPNMPFAWFRPRSGNFFQAFGGAVESLFKGN